MDKPILVITGVSGRLGSAAARQFSHDFHVIGLDIRAPEEEMEFIFTDLATLEGVKDSFHQIREKHGNAIASVIHLAAYYNFEGGAWEKYQKITIDGTKHLLEALSEFEVEQFIFSSTMLVHVPCRRGEKINEQSEVKPKWEYPLSKVKTEELIHEKRGAMPCVILRIAGVYTDVCDSIPISQHIIRIYKKKLESHFFPGNVNHGASFLHLEDFIHALVMIVEKRSTLPQEEIFLLGELDVMSYRDLQHEIGMLVHGKSWWTVSIPKWMAKLGASLKKSFIKPWMIDLADDHYDLDVGKAARDLRWEPVHRLKNSLPRMIALLKENPEKWMNEHRF